MKPTTTDWLKEHNLVLQKNGTYKRETLLSKALDQKEPRGGLFESIPANLYGSVEHLSGQQQKSGTEPVKASENKKIRNATKVEGWGIMFDSRLEKFLYGLLVENGIQFQHQVMYVLQEKFRYGTEAIREIKIIVDFELQDHPMIIDSKGWQLADSKIKYKMLKRLLYDKGKYIEIVMPRNQKECKELVERLK